VWVHAKVLLVVAPHTAASVHDVLRFDANMMASETESDDTLGRSRALLLLCQVTIRVAAIDKLYKWLQSTLYIAADESCSYCVG